MLFSSRPRTKHVAVFEVSSCSVAGAHAMLGPGRVATIFAQHRTHFPFTRDVDAVRLLDQATEQLAEVIVAIQKKDSHHPSHIQLVLASPWYISQTRRISYKKEIPFECTRELVETLIGAEIQQLTTRQDGVELLAGGYVVIDKQISQILLNGYSTDAPYGKRITQLDIGLIVTTAPQIVVDRFTDVISRAYGDRTQGITASPYVAYVALRDSVGVAPDTIIVDVGEEITDVAFIKNELFLYQHSFPMGTHGLYRALATEGHYSDAEVLSCLKTVRLGKASSRVKKTADIAVKAFLSAWQKNMRSVIAEGHFGFIAPSECFIVADSAFEVLFTEALSKDVFIQHATVEKTMQTIYVNNDIVNGIVTTASGTVPPDVGLSLILIFTERLLS